MQPHTQTQLVQREIIRFLGSDEPEILCIRGKWGVGKTFTWKQCVKDAYDKNAIKLSRYAYVSLFGVSSLDELRYAIFENTVPKERATTDANIETLKSIVETAEGWGRKGAWLANLIPGIRSYFGAAAPAFFLTVRHQIICIDDLERKSAKLDVGDVLGLLSYLKEQRHCKVAILLNDEAFQANGQEEFNRYFEKVVDASIQFAPTAGESAEIALRGDEDYTVQLRENCANLGISNIRVIKKIERLANILVPVLSQYHPTVLQEAIKSVVLLGWVFYAKGNAPSKEFVTRKRGQFFLGSLKDSELDDQEREWNKLLGTYEFGYCDDFDLALLEGIERGYFDEQRIKSEASKIQDQVLESAARISLTSAWEPYHNSFDDNQLHVIESIYNGCIENIKYIGPRSLDSAVRLLKDLDAPQKAGALLDFYISTRKNETELFNLDNDPFSGDIRDPELLSRFGEIRSRTKITKAPLEALKEIGSGGWGSNDVDALRNLSSDDFYTLFKSLRGDQLYATVSGLAKYSRISNLDEDERAICTKARDALIRIGKESALNRRRVEKYGIVID